MGGVSGKGTGRAKAVRTARKAAMPMPLAELVARISGWAAGRLAIAAVVSSQTRLEGGHPDFVGFGEDDLIGHRRLVQHGHHLQVVLLEAVPGVDQHADAAQHGASLQEGVDQGRPFGDLMLRRLGKAIARQIDQGQAAPQIEKIDLLGAARGVGGAGQAIAPGQRVDQARLADIGPSGEGDFRQARHRQAVKRRRAEGEAAVLGEEQTTRFDAGRLFGVWRGRAQDLACCFMMNHCCKIDRELLHAQ